jgi:hypothetical protein
LFDLEEVKITEKIDKMKIVSVIFFIVDNIFFFAFFMDCANLNQ